jgi:hypothetical protein
MRLRISWLALGASALLTVGCASKEEPARLAVESAEAALNEVRPDVEKYVPDQLPPAEAKLDAIRNDFAKKHYTEVLASVPKFREDMHALEDAAVAKQTQLAAAAHEWEELSEEVPRMVDAIELQVKNLKASKVPANVKTDLETMKATWAEANAAATAGNTTEAADKGRMVQSKAREVSEQLGMSPV